MPHNPLIDVPAEASQEEIAARRAAATRTGPIIDLPAEISANRLAIRKALEEQFAAKQAPVAAPTAPAAPAEQMSAPERFAGAAAGGAIGALGWGDIAGAASLAAEGEKQNIEQRHANRQAEMSRALMAGSVKRAAVAHKLNENTGGRLMLDAMDVVAEAGRDWAKGALAVKEYLLPPEQQKGDLAEHAGSLVGGLVGLGGVAHKFGALALGATGAGQAALPVYYETLSKTGSEEKAIQAAMPALGVGATYALPAGQILAKAGTGVFGRALLAATAEGGLGAGQAFALDKILENATGEDMNEVRRMTEEGGLGFLTTLGIELIARGKAHISGKKEKARTEGALGRLDERALAAGDAKPVQGPEVVKLPEAAPEAPGAPAAKEAAGSAPQSLSAEPVKPPAAAETLPEAARQEPTKEGIHNTERFQQWADRARREAAAEGVSETLIESEAQGKTNPAAFTERFFGKGGAFEAMNDEGKAGFQKAIEKATGSPNVETFLQDFIEGNSFEDIKVENKRLFGLILQMSEAQRQHEAGSNPFTRRAPEMAGPAKQIAAAPEPAKQPELEAEPDDATVQMYAGLPPLRGEGGIQKGKLKKAGKAIVEGLLKTHGGKPESAALMEERARGEVELEASKARSFSKVLRRAVKAHNKNNPATKVTNKQLFAALTDPAAMAKLPDAVRVPAQKMREHSDAMSRIIVNEGMTSETMSEVVEGRMGEYLRRSYKAHQDPDWAERVPQDVRNRLESLLVSWAQPASPATTQALEASAKAGSREADFELRHRAALQGKSTADIRAEMKAMLQDAKRVAENPWAAFAKSKLKRQDVSLFKARKGLPEEMRAFLGEEKDPYNAYTTTILKQASYVATHRKFREMRAEGLGKWLFEKPTTKDGIDYTARVSAEDNPRLVPLVGDSELYSTEGIKKALFDADRQMMHPAMRAAVVLNALLKAKNTIYTPFGVTKQAASQVTSLASNGHIGYAVTHPKKIIAAMYGRGAEGKALHEDLVRLQVVDTSVAAAEFKDVQQNMANRKLNQPYAGALVANEWAAALYSQPDNFSKTAGYLKELQRAEKAGFKGEAAKRRAANIVKNTYPTYARIVPWIDKYRKQPILGTYMAFKAEQVRTTVERLRLIRDDLKSGNKVLRNQARLRAASWMAGLSLPAVGAYAWNMLNGIDREDDERRRDRIRKKAPWDAERTLAYVDRGGGYTDLSDIDDGSWIRDPLMRVTAGADADVIFNEMYEENIAPFAEPSMFTKFLYQWGSGQNEYGHKFKNWDERWKWLKGQAIPKSWTNFDSRDITGVRIKEIR